MASNRTKRITIPLLLAIAFILFALTAFADFLYNKNRLYPGIQLKDQDVGGMSQDEMEALLNGLELTFTGPDGFYTGIPLIEMGIKPHFQETYAAGRQLGRRNPWPLNCLERLALYREGAFLPLHYSVDNDIFSQSIGKLAAAFNREPQDAYFKVSDGNGRAELTVEKDGYIMDQKELMDRIIRTLAHLNTPLSADIPVREVLRAEITAASLQEKGIEGLMSSFSTRFNPENTNRTRNIELGASYLHNNFLPPGGVLSVNAVLGDSTKEKGYLEAPVIIGGELVQGLGGGLCQISTTLYNAALLGNMTIIERKNHGLTIPYVEPGRDATIAFSATDLKIRNNRDHHVLITAHIEADNLTFRLFGQPMEERVEITTRTLETYEPRVRYKYDPNLPPGKEKVDEGQPGYLVEVWKIIYRGDEVIDEDRISLDRYSPHPTVIWRGPEVEKST